MKQDDVQAEFEVIIRKFLAYRRKHGGILLPDVVMVERAFDKALVTTKLRKPYKPDPDAPVLTKAEYTYVEGKPLITVSGLERPRKKPR